MFYVCMCLLLFEYKSLKEQNERGKKGRRNRGDFYFSDLQLYKKVLSAWTCLSMINSFAPFVDAFDLSCSGHVALNHVLLGKWLCLSLRAKPLKATPGCMVQIEPFQPLL